MYFSYAFICMYMHKICKKYARDVSMKVICKHVKICTPHFADVSAVTLRDAPGAEFRPSVRPVTAGWPRARRSGDARPQSPSESF